MYLTDKRKKYGLKKKKKIWANTKNLGEYLNLSLFVRYETGTELRDGNKFQVTC